MTILNVLALIVLGIILQIGGAYIVNAAVECLAATATVPDNSAAVSASAAAALQYQDYMGYIQSIEPRQFAQIIFVGPLVEELVFRLIFLRAGKMVLPFWAANIVQSLLFAIYHNVTIQRIYVFVMGLIIGAVFYYCPIIYRNAAKAAAKENAKDKRSLLDLPNCLIGFGASFILHMVINTSGLFLVPLFPADIAIALQFSIGGLMMAIAGVVVYYLYRQQRAAKRLRRR